MYLFDLTRRLCYLRPAKSNPPRDLTDYWYISYRVKYTQHRAIDIIVILILVHKKEVGFHHMHCRSNHRCRIAHAVKTRVPLVIQSAPCFGSHQTMLFHLRLKQHSKPDLPRNQQHPMKRITDRAAVDQSRARKKFDVLIVELFFNSTSAAFLSIQKGHILIPLIPTRSSCCS